MKSKKIISLNVVILLVLFVFPVKNSFAQIPVTDGANATQSIINTLIEVSQMLVQIDEMRRQYGMMEDQYDMMGKQYDSMTGNYGHGNFIWDEAMKSAKNVPGSWQDIVDKQTSGIFKDSYDEYNLVLNILPEDKFPQDSRVGQAYDMSANAVVSGMAGAEVLYDEIQVHLTNIDKLAKRIDTTTNIKEAQDLHNRIAAEQALLQTATGKVNVLQMNLESNAINQRLQAEARNQEFNTWQGNKSLFE